MHECPIQEFVNICRSIRHGSGAGRGGLLVREDLFDMLIQLCNDRLANTLLVLGSPFLIFASIVSRKPFVLLDKLNEFRTALAGMILGTAVPTPTTPLSIRYTQCLTARRS